MQKTLKVASILMMVGLGIASIVFLVLGGFAPLFALATGIVLVYYGVLYIAVFAVNRLQEPYQKISFVVLCLLFCVPIFWSLYDLEGMTNFLLQGVRLDMK